MPLPSFKQWRESSPTTRNQWAAARGTEPLYDADIFAHSTANPWTTKKLLAILKRGKSQENKDSEKKLDREFGDKIEEKVMTPNYEIDEFIKRAKKVAAQIVKDADDGDKKVKDIDAKTSKKKKELEAKKKADDKKAADKKKTEKPEPPKAQTF